MTDHPARRWVNSLDWAVSYIIAWNLILLSPIWFPIWLAIKVKQWGVKHD